MAIASVVPGLNVDAVTIGWLLAGIAAILLGVKDGKAVSEVGQRTPNPWWLLLPQPVYLWLRAKKVQPATNIRWGMVGVSAAVLVICAAISGPIVGAAVSANSIFNERTVEREIARGIEDQTGFSVTVDCPSSPTLKPGTTFQCFATDGSESAFVNVTIQDNDGNYTWELR